MVVVDLQVGVVYRFEHLGCVIKEIDRTKCNPRGGWLRKEKNQVPTFLRFSPHQPIQIGPTV